MQPQKKTFFERKKLRVVHIYDWFGIDFDRGFIAYNSEIEDSTANFVKYRMLGSKNTAVYNNHYVHMSFIRFLSLLS